jgi:hypothetical protein
VTADRRLDTAMPTSAAALAEYRHVPSVPRLGAWWAGANPEPTHRRTHPHRQPPPTTATGGEVNPMRRPSLEERQRQLEEDGSCEAFDGCLVEPDGTCDHGQPSWLLALGLI